MEWMQIHRLQPDWSSDKSGLKITVAPILGGNLNPGLPGNRRFACPSGEPSLAPVVQTHRSTLRNFWSLNGLTKLQNITLAVRTKTASRYLRGRN